MKKILLLIITVPTIMFAQNKQLDLYIAYDDCSIHKGVQIANDTLHYETYSIRFGDKINPEIEYSVNESGSIIARIQMSGKTFPSLLVRYINYKNNNPAIKIDQSEINNKIWVKHIIHSKNTDFSTFFNNFSNVYLVDFNDKTEEIKTAKKVEIIFTPTL